MGLRVPAGRGVAIILLEGVKWKKGLSMVDIARRVEDKLGEGKEEVRGWSRSGALSCKPYFLEEEFL